MAKKYSSVRPKITSPFAQEKQQSAASNRIFAGNRAYCFRSKYFLGNQSKAFVKLSGLALIVGS
jgi:hypothetical protein